MKNLTRIGAREFQSKKDALSHYKKILNSYKFGQSLNESDFEDIMALLNYEYQIGMSHIAGSDESFLADERDITDKENINTTSVETVVADIAVAKVQFNTRCFEVFYSDGTSYYISYLMIINRKSYTPESLFVTACRNCIQQDILAVKRSYFKQHSQAGLVKCQETGELSSWEELVVDHRQPNTFSVLVDRFKEVSNILLDSIEYTTTNSNLIIFKDSSLLEKFVAYHKQKATLRIVRKECNSSRTAMARVKKAPKDLTIVKDQLSLF